jgi:RHS repeat-associated protein
MLICQIQGVRARSITIRLTPPAGLTEPRRWPGVNWQEDCTPLTATRRWMDPFGNARGTEPTWSSTHGFLNKSESPLTGLAQLGARVYDETLGRFLSVDPVFAPDNPQQDNGYSYSANNPVTNADPSGQCYLAIGGGANCGGGTEHVNPNAPSGINPGANGRKWVSHPRAPGRTWSRPAPTQSRGGCSYGGGTLYCAPSHKRNVLAPYSAASNAAKVAAEKRQERQAKILLAQDLHSAGDLLDGATSTCIALASEYPEMCGFTETLGWSAEGAGEAIETADAANSAANGVRLRAQLAGKEIANGHAYQKHVIDGAEYPDVSSRQQFADLIEDTVATGERRDLSRGRTAYWKGGTVVIRNPRASDGGSAYRPKDGYDYFLNSIR